MVKVSAEEESCCWRVAVVRVRIVMVRHARFWLVGAMID